MTIAAAGVSVLAGEGSAAEGRRLKRRLSESEEMEMTSVPKKPREDQLHPSHREAGQLSSDRDQDLNFPLPWESGTPCLVKVRCV